jgi:hypothetical protein
MAFNETLTQRLARTRRESIRPPRFGENLGFAVQFVQNQGKLPKLPPFGRGGPAPTPPTRGFASPRRTSGAFPEPTQRSNFLFEELPSSSQAILEMVRSIARSRQQSIVQTAEEMDLETRFPDVFRALFPQSRFRPGAHSAFERASHENFLAARERGDELRPVKRITPGPALYHTGEGLPRGEDPGKSREAWQARSGSSRGQVEGVLFVGGALITPLSDTFGFTPDIPILREVIQVLTDPITLFTLGFGTPFAAGVRGFRAARATSFLRSTSPIARAGATGGNIASQVAATGRVATLSERAVFGSLERSLRVSSAVLQPFGTGYKGAIAEIAAGSAGLFAAHAVPEDAGLPWQIAAGFAGGAVGAGAVLKGPAATRAARAVLTKNVGIPGMERSRNMRSQIMGTAGRFMAKEDGGVTPRPLDRTAGPPALAVTGAVTKRLYNFQWRLMDLDELIVSNNHVNFAENPNYPKEFQPRDRQRVVGQAQVRGMALELNQDNVMLNDVAYLDRGSPIIGPDGVVEAGNGRVLAARIARETKNDIYNKFVIATRAYAEDLGFDDDAFRAVGANPILVRERLTDLTHSERITFVNEANGPATLDPTPFETALSDAVNISDKMLARFWMSDAKNATAYDSLFSPKNEAFVDEFIDALPMNARSNFLEASGKQLLATGVQRIENAMYARVYTGDAGRRIVVLFSELRDEEFNVMKRALGINLGSLARAKGLLDAGLRNPALDLSEDIAQAVHILAVIRRAVKIAEPPEATTIKEGVGNYIRQATLFPDQSLTSEAADRLLVMIHDEAKSSSRLARGLNEMSEGIINSTNTDVKQAGFSFGEDLGTTTKESLITRAQKLIDDEKAKAAEDKYDAKVQKHEDSGKGGAPPREPDPPSPSPGRAALARRAETTSGSTTPDAPPKATAVDRPGPTGGVNRHHMFSDGSVADEVIDTASAAAAAKTANRGEIFDAVPAAAQAVSAAKELTTGALATISKLMDALPDAVLKRLLKRARILPESGDAPLTARPSNVEELLALHEAALATRPDLATKLAAIMQDDPEIRRTLESLRQEANEIVEASGALTAEGKGAVKLARKINRVLDTESGPKDVPKPIRQGQPEPTPAPAPESIVDQAQASAGTQAPRGATEVDRVEEAIRSAQESVDDALGRSRGAARDSGATEIEFSIVDDVAEAVDARGQITRETPESTKRRRAPAADGPPVAAADTRATGELPEDVLGPTDLEAGLLKAKAEGVAGGGGPKGTGGGPPKPPKGAGGDADDFARREASPFPQRTKAEAGDIRTPSDMLDQIIPAAGLSTRGPFKGARNKLFGFGSENIPQAVWRDFKSASARFTSELTTTVYRHDTTLRAAAERAGIAHTRHGPGGKLLRFTNYDDVHPVYLYLMGEGSKPDWFPQSVAEEMKEVLFQEGLLMKDIDNRFIPTPDYFPRLFRQPEGEFATLGGKGLGGKPGFTLPRNGATYQEMVDLGWRPLHNNPVHTFAERLRAGDEYRQQRKLIQHMEDANMVIKLGPGEDPPDGWRVAKAGPDMEGKSIIAQRRPATGEAVSLEIRRRDKKLKNDLGFYGVTQRRAVPNRMADLLEGGFGDNYVWAKFSKFGFKSDVITVLKAAGQVAKRIKLFLSFFQQMDFFQRAMWSAFTPTAIMHSKGGSVAELPILLGKFVYANFSSGRREQLRQALHSTTPYFKDVEKWKDLNAALLMKHGRQPTDMSIVTRDTALEIMADVGEPRNLPRGLRKAADITEPVRRRFAQLENALQAGLFDGVYIEAQNFALKHHILPSLAKAHPEWTSAQMAKQAVNDVNLMFSTIGEWQTVLRSRPVREVLHNLMFSTNETESLLRQAFSTIKGPNKRLWAEFWVGGALALTVTATAVNLAINNEFLPLDRLSPVSFSRFNTFGVGYNNKFFLADMGNIARNQAKMGIDLLGQMDTVLRTLNPLSFFDSRTAVIPRAVINQIQGEDFFGRNITDVEDRAVQLITDLGMPIGLGNLVGAAGIGAENEGRLGTTGQLVQSLGVNLRAEPTHDFKNRYAQNDFGRDWDDLWQYEKNDLLEEHPNLNDELEIRREEAARNGNKYALTQLDFDEGQEIRLKAQSVSDVDLENGMLTGRQWRDDYQIRQAQQLGASQQAFGRDTITDPRNGFERYLQIVQRNLKPDGNPDWIQIDLERKMLSVADQANLNVQLSSGKTPTVQRYRTALLNLNQSGFFRLEETSWAHLQMGGQGEVLELARRFESWDEFESYAMRTLEAALYPEFGVTARDEATRRFNRISLVQQFRQLKNLEETRWLETAPRALAEEAVFWQFLTTNLEQREFLTGLPLTEPPAPPRARTGGSFGKMSGSSR